MKTAMIVYLVVMLLLLVGIISMSQEINRNYNQSPITVAERKNAENPRLRTEPSTEGRGDTNHLKSDYVDIR